MAGKATPTLAHAVAGIIALLIITLCCKGCKGGENKSRERIVDAENGVHTYGHRFQQTGPDALSWKLVYGPPRSDSRISSRPSGTARSDEQRVDLENHGAVTVPDNQTNSRPTLTQIGAGTRTGNLVQIV